MKEVRVGFETKEFNKMTKQKKKVKLTWKEIILRGLGFGK